MLRENLVFLTLKKTVSAQPEWFADTKMCSQILIFYSPVT